jgi:phosphoglycolate phosphatase
MRYNLALFDLDGTLTDSKEGIIKSFLYVCDHYNIEKREEELYKYIGPPIADIMSDMLNTKDEDKVKEAIDVFRERYSVKGYRENRVFDGIYETLDLLKKSGVKLAVATSKPEPFALKILAHFDLDKRFDYICGASMDGKIAHKPELINKVLSNFKSEKAVMIGDRFYDLVGAKAVGIDAIGVRYGYAPKGELENYNPVFIADTPKDIADFILEK